MPTGLAFAAPPREQTNQAETARTDLHGTQTDEEDLRLQADGILLEDRHHPAGEAE